MGQVYEGNLGGEPMMVGEVVPGDEVSTELRLGRSASSIDMARDRRPRPTKPASIGTPDTKQKSPIQSSDRSPFNTHIIQCLVRKIALIWPKHPAKMKREKEDFHSQGWIWLVFPYCFPENIANVVSNKHGRIYHFLRIIPRITKAIIKFFCRM